MGARSSRGITLIELLVVVSILVLLGAVVVPSVTPSVETRKLREAARSVDTFFASARARAIRNGRPVGVMITPLEGNVRAALTLTLVEVPEIYAGDHFSSTASLEIAADGTITAKLFRDEVVPDQLALKDSIGPGDFIQFGHKGHIYRILGHDTDGGILTLNVDKRGGLLRPASSLPYRIFRSPIILSDKLGRVGVAGGTSTTYQLPAGVAIDLGGCIFPGAVVPVPAAPDNTLDSVTIVFSPSGSLAAIYSNQATRYLPQGPIHVLIGKLKNIQSTAANVPAIRNWLDSSNYYISVGHATGQITTTEVAPVDGASTLPELIQATAFARDNFALGGR